MHPSIHLCIHPSLMHASIYASIHLSMHAYVGEQQKRRASTAMNDRSSRAHSLFIVTLKQTHLDRNVTINSRLFMADLGAHIARRIGASSCCLSVNLSICVSAFYCRRYTILVSVIVDFFHSIHSTLFYPLLFILLDTIRYDAMLLLFRWVGAGEEVPSACRHQQGRLAGTVLAGLRAGRAYEGGCEHQSRAVGIEEMHRVAECSVPLYSLSGL